MNKNGLEIDNSISIINGFHNSWNKHGISMDERYGKKMVDPEQVNVYEVEWASCECGGKIYMEMKDYGQTRILHCLDCSNSFKN